MIKNLDYLNPKSEISFILTRKYNENVLFFKSPSFFPTNNKNIKINKKNTNSWID